MESEQNYACKLCYKMAREAVECDNIKCKKLYCLKCIDESKRMEIKNHQTPKCPYCRIIPLECHPSPFRNKINNTKVKCKYCKKDISFAQIQNHQASKCSDITMLCKICNKSVKIKDITRHTNSNHEDILGKIIKSYHQSNYPMPNPEEVIKKIVLTQKDYGTVPHLGTTGKFYCGGKLGLVCSCCNGNCGPTNGQNCIKCMKLDLIRKGLTIGYLVNGVGSVCWKDSRDHFTCGQMFNTSEEKKTCGKDQSYCKFCRNTTINQQRYKMLIQK